MDDACRVSMLQPLCHLKGNVDGFLSRQRTVPHFLAERFSVVPGHGNEELSLGCLPDLMNGADVGVLQSSRGPGFQQEALFGSRVKVEVWIEELQCDGTVEARVMGFVDHAHAALTDQWRSAGRLQSASPTWVRLASRWSPGATILPLHRAHF